VVHSAGKAHLIPKTAAEGDAFYAVNVKGTMNLLRGLERNATLPRSFVFISSVAVYGREHGSGIDENWILQANDPYGRSKIEAEEVIQNWCDKHKIICTILRLPLIAGCNPPGNLGAMVKGIRNNYYFNIAGGGARKSVVLAADVAAIITRAAQTGGVYNLTDGYHPSFLELSSLIASQLGKKAPLNLPGWLAKIFAKTGDLLGERAPINSVKLRKITSELTFDDTKARELLGWNPRSVLEVFKVG
jgi:nucleoside-diphosphate-sugar epimerase